MQAMRLPDDLVEKLKLIPFEKLVMEFQAA